MHFERLAVISFKIPTLFDLAVASAKSTIGLLSFDTVKSNLERSSKNMF